MMIDLPWGDRWIPADDVETKAIREGRRWGNKIRRFLDSFLKEDMTVLEAGAHHGYYTMYMASRVRHVYAVEPSPREYQRLLTHIKLNNVSNVTPIHVALLDSVSVLKLHVCNWETGCNSFHPETQLLKGAATALAFTVRGDTLVHGDMHIDLIKLDVEGAELKALSGLEVVLSTMMPVIVCELQPHRTRPWGHDPSAVVELMSKWDFVLCDLLSGKPCELSREPDYRFIHKEQLP